MIINPGILQKISQSLLEIQYAELDIGGRPVDISVPTLNALFDRDAAIKNAANLAIVALNASTSKTLSGLASSSPPGTQVGVVIEYGDFGSMSGVPRSQSRPGYGDNSWVAKIYLDDTNYG